jgi:hypothetical protein
MEWTFRIMPKAVLSRFSFATPPSDLRPKPHSHKESRPKGPGFKLPPKGMAQGTGHKAKTGKEDLSSPYTF